MESRFLHDFGHVRVHADTAAAESARELDAAAYSVGQHVVFGRGRYAPHTPAGWPLIAHELSHAALHARLPMRHDQPLGVADAAAAPERSARDAASLVFGNGRPSVAAPGAALAVHRAPAALSDIPESERLVIKASSAPVSVPAGEIKDVFATTGDRTSYDPGGDTVFGSGIDKKLQRGLTSVGGYLVGLSNVLPLNTTIDVALDLRPHGGANSIYRFTWFKHTEAKKSASVMIVELIGPAVAATAVARVPSGSFKIGAESFKLAGTWSADEFGQLQQVLGALPALALTEAGGLTFRRSSGNGPGSEAGHYEPTSDTVVLFDNAFNTSSLRVGGATGGGRNVLHEVGHGIDLRVTERAFQTFNRGGQTAAGRTKFLAVRSPSGNRYVDPGGGAAYKEDPNLGAPREGDFRTAVAGDKVKPDTSKRTLVSGDVAHLSGGITEYSDKDFMELFAESYALFVLDPDKLRLLRPKTFAYFQKRYTAPTP
jgi:hypothetical protein